MRQRFLLLQVFFCLVKQGRVWERLCSMEPLVWKKRLFSVVLVEPKIPPNVGAVSRTCAVTGAPLYIAGPVTFREDHPARRRAGLDYWEHAEKYRVSDLDVLRGVFPDRRFFLFTKKAEQSLYDCRFRPGDFLVFGSETEGLADELLEAHPEERVRIPMLAGFRSLNLATAVGIVLYEALRQIEFGRRLPADWHLEADPGTGEWRA